MELLKKVKNTISKYSMLSHGDHVLIGLSGGADSVSLTLILTKLRRDFNLSLSAVYINHGLRPEETKNEESFCKALCDNLAVDFFIKTADVEEYAKDRKLNIQEAARELRYQAYEGLSDEINASRIALGHNADDQTETVLMRLLRGSGRRGLSGIPPVRGKIIRPLIEIERREIEDFLSVNSSLITHHSSLSFMIDSSNLKKDYLRNKIRLTVVPELKKQNPSLVKGICRVADIAREEDAYLELIVTKTLMKLVSRKNKEAIELFLLPLETMDRAILRRVLRRAIDSVKGLKGIDFVHIEDIIRLIKSGRSGNRLNLPEGVRAVKRYSTLLLTSMPALKLLPCTFTVPGEQVLKDIGITLTAQVSENKGDESSEIHTGYDGRSAAVFDLDSIHPPLMVRARKDGDYFYPSGFGMKKKLQDFFVDNKIPKEDRDAIPVLVSGEDIIWIVGHRADERFRAKDDTKRFLIIKAASWSV
ncbi:MAG: tRNA lysidine(34) synthetase TilS [Nitrospirae bacterium]|nr:tRNA lysidine(34) synthetase TilS [Nitrospirota bacterium]